MMGAKLMWMVVVVVVALSLLLTPARADAGGDAAAPELIMRGGTVVVRLPAGKTLQVSCRELKLRQTRNTGTCVALHKKFKLLVCVESLTELGVIFGAHQHKSCPAQVIKRPPQLPFLVTSLSFSLSRYNKFFYFYVFFSQT